MNVFRYVYAFLFIFINISQINCWTDEDLQLFDLVENTDRKFYDILGVDQKASAGDIRKAYRRLSQLYHPDRNKDPNAEETFRKIAAISEVLRNEEQRKKYDVILQTGLPDWREPIYYYRRVRNMGLFELIIFLFCLATLGQYLFAWSVYWERKYEIEEVFLAKLRKKAKHQRKGKNTKVVDEIDQSSLDICNIPKPRCQDLFPVQLVYFLLHMIKSSPSYLISCLESLQSLRKTSSKNDVSGDVGGSCVKREVKQKTKRHIEPLYPELSEGKDGSSGSKNGKVNNAKQVSQMNGEIQKDVSKKVHASEILDSDISEFKKAMKKFPNGTLQRWEKIAEYLNCSVPEVVTMAKSMKSQQFTRNVPIAAQGLTGIDDFQGLNSSANCKIEQNDADCKSQNGPSPVVNGYKSILHRSNAKNESSNANTVNENVWKQEEQRLLEIGLQKYSKETPSRWDRIAEFVQSKTKEECIARYKWLAQEIRRKKDKEN